ncbi:membrane bound O-acyl transferase family-domain-containing protein [Lentinula guzmanii]|uniref:Membrane bound O-acyl transferase family-domain-containing protein n=1 Tax=Lentinula guzmanii TaxID=2804957 RepID=A0AA38J317_9AGAR|nr:membrane bound O-acyl transferase family-domain-containing protein [Lentinula guzmanii]
MDEYTVPTSAQPLLFSIRYIFFPALILSCLLAFKSSSWIRLLFLAWYTAHLLQGMSMRTGNSWSDYSNGSTLGGELMKTLSLLFLVNPAQDWCHRSDGNRKIANRPWWQRIYWCFCAAYTMRGVGWNFQVPGVPSPSRMNRYMFLACAVLRVVVSYLLLDAAQCLMQVIPFFNDPEPDASMRSYSYRVQVFYTVVCFSVPYGSIRFYYYLGAFFAVLTGYSSQEDWPSVFGSWADACSVRNIWGKTWHQMFRRQYSSIGKAVAKRLGAPPGSISSFIVQLFAAFLVSGIMHLFGDYTIGLKHIGVTLPFFVLQPFAILFEEFFFFGLVCLKVDKHIFSLPTPIKRCFGYLWTLVWFTYSSSWYIDPIAQAKFGRNAILPFSVIRFFQL